MNLQQLYYFRSIAKLKSYTLAAKELMVTQSSLSHAITDMEKELGLPMFDRKKQSVELTRYGASFLPHVETALEELEVAKQEVQRELNASVGTIHLSLVPNLSYRFIPELIRSFYSEDPTRDESIAFKFHETLATRKTLESLKNGEVDLGFAAKIDDDEMDFFEVAKEEMILIVSKRHHLASRKCVYLSDLPSETLITYNYSCGTRYFIDKVLTETAISPQKLVELETEKMMASAVASDLGVCILSKSDFSRFDVVPLILEDSRLQRPLYMMWPRNIFMRPVVKTFLDFVVHRLGDS